MICNNCNTEHDEGDLAKCNEALLVEIRTLRHRDACLTAMEAAGVDNWQGIDEVDWPTKPENEPPEPEKAPPKNIMVREGSEGQAVRRPEPFGHGG